MAPAATRRDAVEGTTPSHVAAAAQRDAARATRTIARIMVTAADVAERGRRRSLPKRRHRTSTARSSPRVRPCRAGRADHAPSGAGPAVDVVGAVGIAVVKVRVPNSGTTEARDASRTDTPPSMDDLASPAETEITRARQGRKTARTGRRRDGAREQWRQSRDKGRHCCANGARITTGHGSRPRRSCSGHSADPPKDCDHAIRRAHGRLRFLSRQPNRPLPRKSVRSRGALRRRNRARNPRGADFTQPAESCMVRDHVQFAA